MLRGERIVGDGGKGRDGGGDEGASAPMLLLLLLLLFHIVRQRGEFLLCQAFKEPLLSLSAPTPASNGSTEGIRPDNPGHSPRTHKYTHTLTHTLNHPHTHTDALIGPTVHWVTCGRFASLPFGPKINYIFYNEILRAPDPF